MRLKFSPLRMFCLFQAFSLSSENIAKSPDSSVEIPDGQEPSLIQSPSWKFYFMQKNVGRVWISDATQSPTAGYLFLQRFEKFARAEIVWVGGQRE